jgi:hypothetical protein
VFRDLTYEGEGGAEEASGATPERVATASAGSEPAPSAEVDQ